LLRDNASAKDRIQAKMEEDDTKKIFAKKIYEN
jgi:ABC-type uncharacterized transport system substrate-binding protein